MPDNPVVTVAIAGDFRAGKSTVALILREALFDRGVPHKGPSDLPRYDLNAAVSGLKKRGLSVEIVEIESDQGRPIDARFRVGGAEFLRLAGLQDRKPLDADDIMFLRSMGFDPVGVGP